VSGLDARVRVGVRAPALITTLTLFMVCTTLRWPLFGITVVISDGCVCQFARTESVALNIGDLGDFGSLRLSSQTN
jgi:hypothetical protein